jgi:hypothetical protein
MKESNTFHTVSVRTFVFSFHYGSGSRTVINYGSGLVPLRQISYGSYDYGSGFATLGVRTSRIVTCCFLNKILFRFLRQMIEDDNQFLEVTALGSKLAWRVMKLWMTSAGRTLNNYQVILTTLLPIGYLFYCFLRCTQLTLYIPLSILRANKLFKGAQA